MKKGFHSISAAEISSTEKRLALNAFFVMLFAKSALLFRRAGVKAGIEPKA